MHAALPQTTAAGTAQRAWLRGIVDVFPPVHEEGEAICCILSFEYEEGDWWYDKPPHAPADVAARTWLDGDGHCYDLVESGSFDYDWTDYN